MMRRIAFSGMIGKMLANKILPIMPPKAIMHILLIFHIVLGIQRSCSALC